LALLNHLTVPLKRSTCAPLSCGLPRKGAISGSAKKCVRIVLLTGGAVKAQRHTSMFAGKGRSCRAGALARPGRAQLGLASKGGIGRTLRCARYDRGNARALATGVGFLRLQLVFSKAGPLARWSRRLSQPQDPRDGLGIADASIEHHPFRLR